METALSTQIPIELYHKFIHVSNAYDHDILLSKLKLYGISGKDIALYRYYLDNRHLKQQYIMTLITAIKFEAGLK